MTIKCQETPQEQMILRFLAEPSDVNFGGKVHGGEVMKWIDQAGYTCAVGWSGRYCVTAYVGGIQFLKPIRIGALVEADARVIYTGRSSMHVSVDIHATNLVTGDKSQTTQCIMIFVAVDEDGRPVPVKQWVPQSEDEIKRENYAKKLMELRKDIQEVRDEFQNT